MAHQGERADYGSITLANQRFLLSSPIDESIVNIHSRKVNQGDPGPDDHPVNSTWVSSDWTGGGQVRISRPDIITGRFDFATAETEPAKTISLPPLPDEWEDPLASGSDSMVLGTYTNKVWASWGADIRSYDSTNDEWDDMGTNLTAAPVKKGITWRPSTGASAGDILFCIPLGSSFDYIDGVTRTNVALAAVDLVSYDNKLFRVGADGSFSWTADLTTWSTPVYIGDGSTPTRLNIYMTVGGEPTVYVTTNESVWAFDETSGNLLQTQLQYPKHPDQGRASVTWRGEFFTSVGDGVHRYNRSTISAEGLDRDDGLPDDYRGIIIDMEPAYNAIFAILSGVEEITAQADDETILFAGDDYMTASPGSATNLVMKWNGLGWHYVDSINGTRPTSIIVSSAEDDYGVWYAVDKKIRRIRLSRTYLNIRQNQTKPVQESAWFETNWYNYGWEGQTKVLKLFEIFVENATDDEKVTIFYKTDNDLDPWTEIGQVTTPGEHAFYLGEDPDQSPDPDDPNHFIGIPMERVKYRLELQRGSNIYNRPIVKWFTSVARKMLRPVRTFRVVLDITTTNDYTAQELRDVLLTAIRTPGSASLVYQNETIKVDVVALEFRSMGEASKIVYIAKLNLIESNETLLPHDIQHLSDSSLSE